jgi:hypothetical protein
MSGLPLIAHKKVTFFSGLAKDRRSTLLYRHEVPLGHPLNGVTLSRADDALQGTSSIIRLQMQRGEDDIVE